MRSKTIILSNPENSQRGILTLYEQDDMLCCKIRLYGISTLPPTTKIGVYHQGQVYSANLIERSGCYHSSLIGEFDICSDFFCALVNQPHIIMSGGTYAGYYFNQDTLFDDLLTPEEPTASRVILRATPEESAVRPCHSERSEESTALQDTLQFSGSPQSERFSCHSERSEESTAREESTASEEPTHSIISALVPQFEYIYQHYPENAELNTRLRGGRFVNMDEGEYSLGAIYKDDQMLYICYAVRSEHNAQPPAELGEHWQWLPLDTADPLSAGYYIVFQNADTLEIIQL